MIRALKDFAKRHWPALRLRTLLFLTLLFVAALPGVGAVFLRVYENTLVQQTEAELIAQGAVLAGAYRAAWPKDSPIRRRARSGPSARPSISARCRCSPRQPDARPPAGRRDPSAARAALGAAADRDRHRPHDPRRRSG